MSRNIRGCLNSEAIDLQNSLSDRPSNCKILFRIDYRIGHFFSKMELQYTLMQTQMNDKTNTNAEQYTTHTADFVHVYCVGTYLTDTISDHGPIMHSRKSRYTHISSFLVRKFLCKAADLNYTYVFYIVFRMID